MQPADQVVLRDFRDAVRAHGEHDVCRRETSRSTRDGDEFGRRGAALQQGIRRLEEHQGADNIDLECRRAVSENSEVQRRRMETNIEVLKIRRGGRRQRGPNRLADPFI